MAAMERHIRLAQDLHPRLLRFFTRFPPSLINGATQPSAEPQYPRNRNPFLAFKNPSTGNWHAPHYSLRRQAELFKLAKEFDVLPLMPHSPKHPEIKEQKRIENGLRVQGTGIGKRVKGKLWERTLKGRLAERTKAMEGMPEMIRQWKERGHGRGWKKWPK
jgi:large subunit ribosomal protein L25